MKTTGMFLALLWPELTQAQVVGPDGWSVFNESPDTRKVYVSQSIGNDAWTGLCPEVPSSGNCGPKKTVRSAYAELRNGFPDWLLLRSGDVWTEGLRGPDFEDWRKGGRSTSEMMVIKSYGTGPRPLLKTGTRFGFKTSGLQTVGHLAILDLHFWADGNTGQGGVDIGIVAHNAFTDFLLENCVVEQYGIGINFYATGGASFNTNMRLRRNVIYHNFQGGDRVSGLVMGETNGALLEENVFDHNGWSEIYNNVPDIFDHNVYINPDNTANVTVRGNIAARGGSSGFRSCGQLCERNLALQNPVNLIMAHNTNVVRQNVALDSRDIAPGLPRGSGFVGGMATGGQFYENIAAHQVSGTGNASGINFEASANGASVHDNVVYRWAQSVNRDAPALIFSGSLQPTQRIQVYNNKFHQPFARLIEIRNHPNVPASFNFHNNQYFNSDSPTFPPFLIEPAGFFNFSGWTTASGETNSTFAPVSFPDPERTISTYMRDVVQGPQTLDAFLTEARKQSRANWRPQFTALAVIDYIRAGFGMPALGPQMPPTMNQAPIVGAGPDLIGTIGQAIQLDAMVSDDGRPNPPAVVTSTWSKIGGPGAAVFADPYTPDTTVAFSQAGVYVLRLAASDSELSSHDDVTVTVTEAGPVLSHRLYPNPARDQPVTLSLELDRYASGATATIYSLSGQSVGQLALKGAQSQGAGWLLKGIWNHEGLPSGVYMVVTTVTTEPPTRLHSKIALIK